MYLLKQAYKPGQEFRRVGNCADEVGNKTKRLLQLFERRLRLLRC